MLGDTIPELEHFNAEYVNKWLSQFFMEVRKQNGELYPAKSLYLLASGILRHFRDCGLTDMNFLNDSDDRFLHFRKCLDSQMKWITRQGICSEIKQAEPVTSKHEETLWTSGSFDLILQSHCRLQSSSITVNFLACVGETNTMI